jgi:hypothetical protein
MAEVSCMEKNSRTLTIPSDSELADLIRSALASGTPFSVDTGDGVYLLEVQGQMAPRAEAPPQDPGEGAQLESPEDFYRRAVARPDVAEILRRLSR